jgi:transposase
MTITADTLVPEQLWQTIQPLLPPLPRRYGGRSRVDDRAALAGIVYAPRRRRTRARSGLPGGHLAAVVPEVLAADAREHHADDGIGWRLHDRVGPLAHLDATRAGEEDGTHG